MPGWQFGMLPLVLALLLSLARAADTQIDHQSERLSRQHLDEEPEEPGSVQDAKQQGRKVPWHLDRLDQRALPLDGSFNSEACCCAVAGSLLCTSKLVLNTRVHPLISFCSSAHW